MQKNLILFSVLIVSAISTSNDRTVNIAIETSFQFEPKDINNEKGIVTNLKSFIDKIYRSLEPAASQNFRQTPDKITLSKFLTDFGNSILNLTDENFHNVVKTLIKQLHEYRTSRSFHSIFSDSKLKKDIKKMVYNWANTDAKKLKRNLQELITNGNPDLQKLTSQLNTLYNKQDLQIFYKYNKKLNKYLGENKNLDKLIKDWLDFSIFERYNKLNASSKVKVMDSLRSLSDYFTGNTTFKSQVDSNSSLWLDHDEDVSGSVGDEVHTHHRHSHYKKMSRREQGTPLKNEDDGNKITNTLQLIKNFFQNEVLGKLGF